jgi:hypothetical protein
MMLMYVSPWAASRHSAGSELRAEIRNAYLAFLAPIAIVLLVAFFVWLNAR